MNLKKSFNVARDAIRVKLSIPGQVVTVSEDYLNTLPEGEPIPSILPQEGYGNHSCQDCRSRDRCGMANFVSLEAGGKEHPNGCSYYWPPNSSKEPGSWYWKEISNIVKYRKNHGMSV